jgi:hypothetical protein
MSTTKKVLSLRKVRKQLGFTKKQLREWIKRGYLSPTVVGKSGYKGFVAGHLTGKPSEDEPASHGKRHERD